MALGAADSFQAVVDEVCRVRECRGEDHFRLPKRPRSNEPSGHEGRSAPQGPGLCGFFFVLLAVSAWGEGLQTIGHGIRGATGVKWDLFSRSGMSGRRDLGLSRGCPNLTMRTITGGKGNFDMER